MRARAKQADRGLTVVRALLLVGAVVLIGVLVYRQVTRLSGPRTAVLVSASTLRKGQTIGKGDLTVMQAGVPNGAIVRRADVEGRALLTDKPAGQPFFPTDLAPKAEPPHLSATVPEGRVLATVRISTMDLPVPELRHGNRVDLLQATREGVRMVAHDAYVMGVLQHAAPKAAKPDLGSLLGVDLSVPNAKSKDAGGDPALVLGIRPQDVYSVAAAEVSQPRIKVVLHADREVKAGQLLDVRPPQPAPTARRSAGSASVQLILGATTQDVRVP